MPTIIEAGVLEITGLGTLGSGSGNVTIADGAVLRMNQAAGITTFVSNKLMNAAQPGSQGGRFIQSGAGTTIISATNDQFTGSFEVEAGVIVALDSVGSPLYGARTITVGIGAANSGTLIAAGQTAGTVSIAAGGTLSVGARLGGDHEAPGVLEAGGGVDLSAGSTVRFQFLGGLQATGVEGLTGADQFDQLNAAYMGSWDLISTTAIDLVDVDQQHRIHLRLFSMADATTPGANTGADGSTPLADTTENLHWLFATTTGGVTLNGQPFAGNINDYFDIDASGVVGAGVEPLKGSFYISQVGGDLYLNYSAVPEPGSLILIGVAGMALVIRRRRAAKLAAGADVVATTAAQGDCEGTESRRQDFAKPTLIPIVAPRAMLHEFSMCAE